MTAKIPPAIYPETAAKYMNIFNSLHITDVLGNPSIKDLTQKLWYKDFAEFFFGTFNEKERIRAIQEFFVLIPKKNMKSTASGLIMLSALVSNPYRGAEFALIAPSHEVVDNCFLPIVENINVKQKIYNKWHFLEAHTSKDGKRYILDKRTNATLKITTPLMSTNQGKKWQGVLIEEVALWQSIKKSTAILNEISGNLVNKKDSFIIYLTTQSYEPPYGVFNALLDRARSVEAGGYSEMLKQKFFPLLYEFSKEQIKSGFYKNPDNWHIVNPALDISVDKERLMRMQKDAENAGLEAENEFYAKYLNVQINIAQTKNSWAGAKYWEDCEKKLSLDELIDSSVCIYLGIDGGGLDDLTGLAVLGIDKNGIWRTWCYAYGVKSVLDRAGLSIYLQQFQEQGTCKIFNKIGDDAEQIAKDVEYLLDKAQGKVNKIGIDPRGGMHIINKINQLTNKIEFINQGTSQMQADSYLTMKLAQQQVIVSKSDLMRFCVGNAVVEERGDDYFLSKKSSQFKIDPLIALLNCVQLVIKYGDKATASTSGNDILDIKKIFDTI